MKVLFVSILLSFLSSACVDAAIMYQLVVLVENPPPDFDVAIEKDEPILLKDKFNFAGFTTLFPGDSTSGLNRNLLTETSAGLRGFERALQTAAPTESGQGIGYCPKSCSTSGSKKCRSLGCAYCGVCGRRLQNALTFNEAKKIEKKIDQALDEKQYCGKTKKCSMKAQILLVNPDGTTTPVTA
jgi:hypothetical protein